MIIGHNFVFIDDPTRPAERRLQKVGKRLIYRFINSSIRLLAYVLGFENIHLYVRVQYTRSHGNRTQLRMYYRIVFTDIKRSVNLSWLQKK